MKSVYIPFALILIALVFAAIPSAGARSQELTPFTVEGVRADASAESATKARESAFAQAQSAAFATLASRVLSPQDVKRLNPPDATAIGPMIQDFEIVNEKISTVRYIGTYTFRFNPDAVRSFLSARGLTPLDIAGAQPGAPAQGSVSAPASARTLILPFYETAGQTLLWGEDNPWRKAWQTAAPPGTVLPAGDLDEMQAVPDNAAMTYDPGSVREMTGRYGAVQAIVAVARPLPDPYNASATGSVEVYLYQATPSGPKWMQTLSTPVAPGTDPYAQAVRSVSQALAAQGSGSATPTLPVTLYLAFSGPEEWMATRGALETLYGLNGLKILSLTPRRAVLQGAFAGDETAFVSQTQAQGLTLASAQEPHAYNICLPAYCKMPGGGQ